MEQSEQIANLPDGDTVHQVPVWVVPRRHELRELLVMASMTTQNAKFPANKRLFCGGVVDATAWVQGYLFGPVTGCDESPVTLLAAQLETAIADDLVHGHPHHEVRDLCASLNVSYRPPLEGLHRDVVRGAWMTLRWLTGVDENPPLPIPWRRPDGSLVTASELYDALLRREPDADAQRRTELRRQAVKSADQNSAIAEILREDMEKQRRRR